MDLRIDQLEPKLAQKLVNPLKEHTARTSLHSAWPVSTPRFTLGRKRTEETQQCVREQLVPRLRSDRESFRAGPRTRKNRVAREFTRSGYQLQSSAQEVP